MRDLNTLPKAHLHLHFEGSARLSTANAILARTGGSLEIPERWPSFEVFNDAYASVVMAIGGIQDLEQMAREIVEDDAAAGVRYIEPIFLPMGYDQRFGMTTDEVFDAITAAFREAAAPHGIEVGFQIAGIWHFGTEHAERVAAFAVSRADDGVVAFNLCGIEPTDYTPWQRSVAIARDGGLRIVPHAGEFGPAANVRAAIDVMDADRICHGVRAVEDAAVVDLLADRQVVCDIAPTSNEVLQVIPAFADSPVQLFLERGIPFTINADDSLFFGSGIGNEYVRVAVAFGLSDGEMADLARTSVRASFAPEPVKQRILGEIDAWETGEV